MNRSQGCFFSKVRYIVYYKEKMWMVDVVNWVN
jgi:hypothetical protein